MGNKLWTSEDTERLIALVKSGYSGGAIAEKLGITRSSVIGKAHRLGLKIGNSRNGLSNKLAAKLRKPHQTPFNKRRDIKVISKPVYEKAPVPPQSIEDVARLTFPELEAHHCRFPVGHPKEPGFGFCGLERAPGRPYCESHAARCFTPVPVRKRPEPVTAPSQQKVDA